MKRGKWVGVLAFIMILGVAYAMREVASARQSQQAGVPMFQVDPFWPKFEGNWLIGGIGGIAIDPTNDHVFIYQRPTSLGVDEVHRSLNPPMSDCCVPAPPVMEFDPEGHLIRSWGGPGSGYEWFQTEHGITIDHRGNVWLAGSGAKDAHVLKFTKAGKFLLQVGHAGKGGGSNDLENFGGPSDLAVYPETNEIFIADGDVNRRVVVIDADTGRYKRHWGAYGKKPDDNALRERISEGPGPRQFNVVHTIKVSNDGLIYSGERINNRIQVFKPDGTFVREGYVSRKTLIVRDYIANGTVCDMDFSPDKEQKFLYVADCANYHVWILNRDTLKTVGNFSRQGRNAGQFYHLHALAVDSKGNIYTGESPGKRVQKFLFKGFSSTSYYDPTTRQPVD